MKSRPDLLDPRSPAGLQVWQLTDDLAGACHVYMEAQVFTPNGSKLVLHRSAHPHGSNPQDPQHQYLLCDLADGGPLQPLTEELGVTAPAVSPDGRWLYYFVDRTRVNGGEFLLRRVQLDGSNRETVLAIDAPLPGMKTRISRPYPLSTISSDGRRIATAGYFGDGVQAGGPWGLLVIDIDQARAQVALAGPTFCNLHPQYSRSLEPQASHDLLIQENHGCETRADGTNAVGTAGNGCDVHVIRDDGSDLRDLPWGRDGDEHVQGHQCWRGRSGACIGTVGYPGRTLAWGHEERVLEATPGKHAGHVGRVRQDGQRIDLSQSFERTPRFFHFATDIAGTRMVIDYDWQARRGCEIYLAELGESMQSPPTRWQYLLDSRTAWSSCHPHPFLSPDGTRAFFNSNESGRNQAYMVTGF